MKSFIAALILLSLAVAFTVGNAVLLEKRFGTMLAMVETLAGTPDAGGGETVEELLAFLKRHGKYMALTVRASVLQTLDETLLQAKAAAASGGITEWKFALESLRKQLKTAKNAEKASFGKFF